MGQKVHPYSFRLGVIKEWSSRWYSTKEEFAEKLLQDAKIRKVVKKELNSAMLSKVDVERASNRVRVLIHSGRPGMVIGRKGAQIERVKEKVQDIVGQQTKLFIDIKEVKNSALDAQIAADNVAFQLEKRVPYRRVVKKMIQNHRDIGGEGIKIRLAGRLAGAEIARAEVYKWGKIPLQTIRADIDYAFSEASTTYGVIGIKVWIYKGEKFEREIFSSEKKKEQRRK